ncbi:ABC transporter ATP-binding protein [Shewanella avicenniae]|uniref:ABC transporter ATP-binding protein n=1 Tax=Shewanella avicenniae TaxID=2814294 RepID=A0ABX7QQR0_9GAMM|nr:ABC transporter ATP-binding protein [Shewanella avicenniae]QSX33619.1 ABC transporter ATP-binding protein [Shewanella avicenniae]
MEQKALLELRNITKQFDGQTVLKGLSLTLYPGMVVGLLGTNGAGKSTLMRIALGIVTADSGDVRILDESPDRLSAKAKAAIGYVAQQPFGYEGFTVAQALNLHRSFYPEWDLALEQEWLQRFGLDGKTAVQKLSIGQRQSLALIMSMAYRPKLLLLDEPVASLDPLARRHFMADLFELALESGSAVLFSSHITSDLERVASHVALVKEGELLLMREIDELREHLRLITLATDELPALPPSIQVLGHHGRTLVIDGYQGQPIAQAQSCLPINLEQLFMELHP